MRPTRQARQQKDSFPRKRYFEAEEEWSFRRPFSNVLKAIQNISFSIILSALFASPPVDKVVTVRESLKTWVDFL